MNQFADGSLRSNPYDKMFNMLIAAGEEVHTAVAIVAEAYLDGKPRLRGKEKIAPSERDTAFWLSAFVKSVPGGSWRSEVLTLALSRYLAQEQVANVELLSFITTVAPETVCRAVRYSGLVLLPKSPRRAELNQIAGLASEIVELCHILSIFDHAKKEGIAAVEMAKAALSKLSPFELLIYASLYAFEHLVPRQFDISTKPDGADAKTEETWYAINDLFIWKLTAATESSLELKEADIGESLAKHLMPFLFPSPTGLVARHDLRAAFEALVDAQVELNDFISRSADAFSYNDSIQFVRCGNRLEIVEIDAVTQASWQRDGRKLNRLHGYWFYRALAEFVNSEMSTRQIGSKENHEGNLAAYLRALRTRLQLSEVYGVDESVATDSGDQVNLYCRWN